MENKKEKIVDYKELLEKTDFTKVPGLKNAHIKLLDKIKENIVNGKAIYEKGWLAFNNSNLFTNKNYDFFNNLVLNIAKDEKGYKSSQWLTFIQMKNLNEKFKLKDEKEIKLKKGSVGEKIVFSSIYDKIEKKNLTYIEFWELPEEERELKLANGDIYFYHKEATVFNSECFENIPQELLNEIFVSEAKDIDIDLAYLMAKEMELKINFTNDDLACYYLGKDCISLPKKEFWKNNEMFKRTLFHELSHATMEKNRLNRKTGMSNKAYAKEEIVAETSSVFLSPYFNYDTETNLSSSSAYLEGWANVIISNPKKIISAITEATKVSNYILEKYESALEKKIELLKEGKEVQIIIDEEEQEEKLNHKTEDKTMEKELLYLENNEMEILEVIQENIVDYMEGLSIYEVVSDVFDGYFLYPSDVYDFLKENDITAFDVINYIKEKSEELGYNGLEKLNIADELKVFYTYVTMKTEDLLLNNLNFEGMNINDLTTKDYENISNQLKEILEANKKTERTIINGSKYSMNFDDTKDLVKGLMDHNYKNLIKAIIGYEKNIDDEGILIEVYNKFMNDDNMNLLSDEISETVENLLEEKNINKNDLSI